MIFLQTNWILAFVFAVILFNAGKLETQHGARRNPGWWWALLCIATSALVIQAFGAGWLLVLIGQIGLFVAITIYRVLREK